MDWIVASSVVVAPVVPPKTEYRLTDDGRKLHEPVAALCQWAAANAGFLDAVHARSGKRR